MYIHPSKKNLERLLIAKHTLAALMYQLLNMTQVTKKWLFVHREELSLEFQSELNKKSPFFLPV
jgi:hypothetical protein